MAQGEATDTAGLVARLWHRMVASAPGRVASLAVRAVNRFIECHGARQGAAVAFYAAFSMAPLLVVVTSLLVWLLGDQSANATMVDAVGRLFGPSEARTLADLLASAPTAATRLLSHERAGGFAVAAPVIAVVTMLVGAVGVFVELRASLQEMLGAPPERGSLWRLVQIRLLSMGVLLGCGFLLAVAMVLQAVALLAIRWVVGQTDALGPALGPLLQSVELLWSWLVMTTLFSLLMVWLPDAHLRARHAFIGAAVAAVLFLAGRYGINAYIAGTALRSTLGAAGSFAALLVWIYWSCQIFLLGAALAVEIGAHERVPHAAAPQAA
jgi:membrane protein